MLPFPLVVACVRKRPLRGHLIACDLRGTQRRTGRTRAYLTLVAAVQSGGTEIKEWMRERARSALA